MERNMWLKSVSHSQVICFTGNKKIDAIEEEGAQNRQTQATLWGDWKVMEQVPVEEKDKIQGSGFAAPVLSHSFCFLPFSLGPSKITKANG